MQLIDQKLQFESEKSPDSYKYTPKQKLIKPWVFEKKIYPEMTQTKIESLLRIEALIDAYLKKEICSRLKREKKFKDNYELVKEKTQKYLIWISEHA